MNYPHLAAAINYPGSTVSSGFPIEAFGNDGLLEGLGIVLAQRAARELT